MTEDEAKTQQCIGPSNCGRIEMTGSLRSVEYHPRHCIGSACKMAWRWVWLEPEIGGRSYGTKPTGEGWYQRFRDGDMMWHRDIAPTDGFCGLAGKP